MCDPMTTAGVPAHAAAILFDVEHRQQTEILERRISKLEALLHGRHPQT